MKIQHIRYFLVLANELHFWRASEKLYTSQSNLSRHIQSLEDEMGVKLFERDKRNVELTAAGKFLQSEWKELIEHFDQSKIHAQKIHKGSAGTISIAYPGSITYNFLPDLLKTLHKELPELKIELTEPTDKTHATLLLDFSIDLSFSRDKIEHPNVLSQKLYSEPVSLVVPNHHRITAANFNDLRDLQNDKFIISSLHHTTYFSSLLRNIFARHGFEPQTLIESDFGSMILALVARELGVTIIPQSFKYAGIAGVRFIELDDEVDLYVNQRKNDDNPVVAHVLSFANEIAEIYKNPKI